MMRSYTVNRVLRCSVLIRQRHFSSIQRHNLQTRAHVPPLLKKEVVCVRVNGIRPGLIGIRLKSGEGGHSAYVNYEELVALLENNDIKLFDVRDAKEIEEQGEFPGAINIPLPDLKKAFALSTEEFQAKYGSLKPEMTDTNIVFAGEKSVKSSAALEIARKLGYTKSRQYVNGFVEWQEKQGGTRGQMG